MGTDRLRVLVLALSSLGLIIAATFVMDWYVVTTGAQMMGVDRIAIDLRSVHACSNTGMCGSVDMSKLRGLYSMFATITLWTSLAFGALVLVQAGSRLITGSASDGLSKRGYLLGLTALAIAGATGFLFGPEVGAIEATPLGLSVEVERTWTPTLLMLGHALGVVTLYYAIHHELADDAPVDYVPLAEARVVPNRQAPSSIPIPTVTPHPVAPTAAAAIPRPRTDSFTSQPVAVIPESCRNKLNYATITAELTRGGIDARREDGETLLVMWRDVVGAVARRLPAVYDGAPFVDIVSNAGSTLRVLPWTRLTGERPDGTGEARARNLVKLIAEHCPEAKLDRATRAFVEASEPAAQLPDLDLLAAHDQRLA